MKKKQGTLSPLLQAALGTMAHNMVKVMITSMVCDGSILFKINAETGIAECDVDQVTDALITRFKIEVTNSRPKVRAVVQGLKLHFKHSV